MYSNNLLWFFGIFIASAAICTLYVWICTYRENKAEERFEKWNSSLDNFEHLLDIYKHMINPKRTPPYNFDTDGKALLDKCQNVIDLISNYNLAVKPNSKIKQLSLYLEKIEHSGLLDEKPKSSELIKLYLEKIEHSEIEHSGLLDEKPKSSELIKNKANTSSFDEMIMQIDKTVHYLNNEYDRLQLDLQKKTAILQNEQNQKNLLSGNIDDLPKEIQFKYYADLGKKLTNNKGGDR